MARCCCSVRVSFARFSETRLSIGSPFPAGQRQAPCLPDRARLRDAADLTVGTGLRAVLGARLKRENASADVAHQFRHPALKLAANYPPTLVLVQPEHLVARRQRDLRAG